MPQYPDRKQERLATVAEEMLHTWQQEKTFEQTLAKDAPKGPFVFYEGPPSANGTPGIHHVMARAVKDLFCRFKTMQGHRVERKGGWDTHGLPVELQVEKELGITKDDIGKKISVEEYNARCRQAVMKYKGQWDDLTQQMGYWVDLDKPYVTFERPYMESLWHILKKLHQKGYLYKGYTIQPYSPKAGTGLSSHELNQPGTYQQVKDTTVTAQFKVVGTEDEYLLAWTTTPWTLPSNTALAVGETITYVKVRTFNAYTHRPITVTLAKDRVPAYFNEKAKDLSLADYQEGDKLIPYQVVEEVKGADLVGLSYEQLLPYVTPDGKAFEVIAGDFVTTEDGTGVVHIAPTFGADDMRVAQKAGIAPALVERDGSLVPLVDKQGRFVEEVTDFAGAYVKAEYEDEPPADGKTTDVLISIKLKEENKAFRVEKYEHSYPHCWRTDKPILYYPLESWFIKTTAIKDQLVAANKTINWKPASTGEGRFGNWLENLVDWNLSRSRFWGTPLPIWRSDDGQEELCIGSLQELRREVDQAVEAGLMDSPLPEDFDLHRPFVDQVVLVKNGKALRREPDLIDVWFDSGAMPYAQWHYPFENQDTFADNFPADFIAEGVDQTRGWFFTLHALAGLLHDDQPQPEQRVAFRNVIANGLVLDKNGNKMSKRLGNAIDPFSTLADHGADPTRWYMLANANPWDNLKFDLDGVAEVSRRFFGTLQNTYSFYALYANLDGYAPKAEGPTEAFTKADRWVLSKLQTTVKTAHAALDDYEPTRAARAIQEFAIDELSNWYVRLNRKRYWMGDMSPDKEAAYFTLYTCLETISRLMAPIAPFYADRLYRDLHPEAGQSVHLQAYPEPIEAWINTDLEERMNLAQHITSQVHAIRRKEKVKVRQPLSRVLIPVSDHHMAEQIGAVEPLIKTEVNVKEVELVEGSSEIVVRQLKPNFPRLGKRLGPKMKALAAALAQFTQEQIVALETAGATTVQLEGQAIELTVDDVEIRFADMPGWSVASDGVVTVALDLTLTDQLRQEGLARELVNRIQNLRKDLGFDVQDKIHLTFLKGDAMLRAALVNHQAYICGETQALHLSMVDTLDNAETFEVEGTEISLSLTKA